MNLSATGLIAGLLIAIATAVAGLTGLLLAVVLGLIGFLVGAQLEGRLDLVSMLRGGDRE